MYIKCTRELHESTGKELWQIKKARKTLCKKCNSFAQFGIDVFGNNFLSLYWDYEKNQGIDPWDISYSSGNKVFLFCQNNKLHGSYNIRCCTFAYYYETRGCPFCNVRGVNGKPHPTDSLGEKNKDSIKYWSDKNDFTAYDVTLMSHKQAWWKCENNIHEDYYRIISDSVISEFRCPKCVNEQDCSILQKKVSSFILNLGFTLKHEYDCNIIMQSKKTTRIYLPYDNEVVELKLIIEVHGSQHYKHCTWHTLTALRNGTTPEFELKEQQKRDIDKKRYAISKGYHYLEIPYYTEKDDVFKQLILDKLSIINNNKKNP